MSNRSDDIAETIRYHLERSEQERQMKKWMSVVLLMFPLTASASLVTSSTSFPTGAKVLDFSQFASDEMEGISGPIQIGAPVGENIVWTATDSDGWLSNFNGWGLDTNGNWTSAHDGYTSFNHSDGSITMTFANPVSAVGGFMNYDPGQSVSGTLITALDSHGAVLETYELDVSAPIVTPGATDGGAFRGIVRPTADIAAFQISNEFVALDDLTFARPPAPGVPTAGIWALAGLMAALAAVALFRMR